MNTSSIRHAVSTSATSTEATSEKVNVYIEDVIAGGDPTGMPNISAEELIALQEDEEAIEQLQAGRLHFALRAQTFLTVSDQQFHSIS